MYFGLCIVVYEMSISGMEIFAIICNDDEIFVLRGIKGSGMKQKSKRTVTVSLFISLIAMRKINKIEF